MELKQVSMQDALLQSYFGTGEEAVARRLLESVFADHVDPIIRAIAWQKLGDATHSNSNLIRQDIEELASDVQVALIVKLHAMRDQPAMKPISNLRAYVAVTAYRACSEVLRRKNPFRWALYNTLRYVLTHTPELAAWQDDRKRLLGGLAAWKKENRVPIRPEVNTLSETLRESAFNVAPFLRLLFEEIERPVALETLVSLLAELQRLPERVVFTESEIKTTTQAEVGSEQENTQHVEHRAEARVLLQQLWGSVHLLPSLQRMVLLLHLRDENGVSVLPLLSPMEIAPLTEIMSLLNMTENELAEIWSKLPLSDEDIAIRLQTSPTKVAKLRWTARQRLLKEMR